MRTRTEVKKLEQTIADIKMLSRVFQYAAARRIKRNSEEIDLIRRYFDAVRGSYVRVKNASVEGKKEIIQKAILTSSLRQAKKREVIVLITAETRYYGTLMSGLMEAFLKEYKRKVSASLRDFGEKGLVSDVILVGKVGGEYLETKGIRLANVTLYHLDDDKPDFSQVSQIANVLGNYQKITIFYSMYVSVFKQEASFDYLDRFFSVDADNIKSNYLFKPTVIGAVGQLEKHMIGAGFLQRLFESGLAKYAYRVRILQIGQVAQRISDALDEIRRIRSTAGRDIENKKQGQLLSGSLLWRKSDVINL